MLQIILGSLLSWMSCANFSLNTMKNKQLKTNNELQNLQNDLNDLLQDRRNVNPSLIVCALVCTFLHSSSVPCRVTLSSHPSGWKCWVRMQIDVSSVLNIHIPSHTQRANTESLDQSPWVHRLPPLSWPFERASLLLDSPLLQSSAFKPTFSLQRIRLVPHI